MALTTPTKPSKKSAVALVDDSRRSESPDTVTSEEEELEALRCQFVGDVDLPEGLFKGFFTCFFILTVFVT